MELGDLFGEGLGPYSEGIEGSGAVEIIDVVSTVVGVMTISAVIWFLFQLLIGGLNWISAAGDKGKLENAQHRITNGIIGLIIVIAGWSILALVARFLGWDDILDPAPIIDMMTI